MAETVVVALGGNAITRPGEPGTIPQQFEHAAETLGHLQALFRSGCCGLVITHGNGPQIGNILIRVEESERRVPRLPLDTCVSDSQGGMGYMIQRLACELFRREAIRRSAATVITQVLVDAGDPDFGHPSKPIGEYYTREQAARLQVDRPRWLIHEIEPGKFRRVVPSPHPLEILEVEAIASLVKAGVVTIACGGGGIPVTWQGGRLVGVEGVVDKDLASGLLASQIGAQTLVIVTSVRQAAIHFGRPDERWLGTIGVAEARTWLEAGEFPAGSMGPKIEAAIGFVERGGEACLITSTENVERAMEGGAGDTDCEGGGVILANARVVTFDGANRVIDSGSVEVRRDGTIGSVGAVRGDGVVDVGGRLVMPALINCHTHLYSTLARGMAMAGRAPKNFPEILRRLWWRLDAALDEDDVYYSALVGLIDAAKCGVGTLIDHHSSPNACAGSLDRIEQAYREVGLRGALCYETSDRNGARGAAAGIRENARFLERAQARGDGMVGASFGLHAAFTLGDRTLQAAVEAERSYGCGFHVHVAEDECDAGAVARLEKAGVLGERTLAAHCLHVSGGDMKTLARRRVNVVHNPQSNCNNAAGTAPLRELAKCGVRVGLGSDGYSARMWDEFKTAFHLQKLRTGDPRAGYAEAYAAAFANNRAIVKQIWGMEIGRIGTGARADVVVLDYFPPTPLRPDNVFGHLLFGVANAPVHALMVNGRFVVRNGQCITVDECAVAERAAVQARALWRRFEES